MGLNDNTKNIELALTEKNKIEQEKLKEKARKEAERKKKQEEKENQKRLEKDIKKELQEQFKQYFDIVGSLYTTEFYSIERKNNILQDIMKKYGTIKTQKWNNGTSTTFCSNQKDIEELFNKYYYKILKDQEKIYKLNEEYLYLKQIEEAEQEQKQKAMQEKKKNRSFVILKYICYAIAFIIFFPITFIFLVVLATMKASS